MSRDVHLLAARVLLAVLLLMSGWGKLFMLGGIAATLGAKGYPAPTLMAEMAAAGELAGALGIVLGLKLRTAAYGLSLYTVLATLTFHAYWTAPDAAIAQDWVLHAWKNAGLIGGLLALATSGAGRYSLDWLLERRAPAPASTPVTAQGRG